ncbi:phage minor head protein [Bacteroides cellulosilyticus]|uniref:phage minor head protein n=1 Tax=Bacteroides cellulosilyticus TaxID=246787 RepID=UPI001897BFB0|nr:phage minor head protein [Bacteroides cellulosilyticus]
MLLERNEEEEEDDIDTSAVEASFALLMRWLHQQPEFTPEMLKEEEVQRFVRRHAEVLDRAVDYSIRQRPLDDISVQRLKESNYVFSGFKTFHELNEAFSSLLDVDGNRKPFERFLNDVQKVNENYNKWYLKAEYNFATASADMAARWKDWWDDEDRDRYLLQYRTVGDKRVRESHRLMHNITLPLTSKFWDKYFPPNGWNCRCTVVRVRRNKYPESNEQEAMNAGSQATAGKHQEMMRFNSGKQMACFPAYNPYTISRCKNCPNRPGTVKLAKTPGNELCAACKVIKGMTAERMKIQEQYEAYDAERWKKEFYDSDNGGYLVTEKTRIEAGGRNKQEQAKYDKEHEMCLVFAHAGYRIEHLGETPGISSPDVTINGVAADLKRTKGSGNIVRYARKAVRQQGAKVVLFQFDEFNEAVRKELVALKREGIKAKYFVTGENEVHTL